MAWGVVPPLFPLQTAEYIEYHVEIQAKADQAERLRGQFLALNV